MKTRTLIPLVILCMLSSILYAQNTVSPVAEMATGLRSSGKIYVVVACITVIFTGIVWYLISLEKRVKKLEKKSKPK